eukprot:gene8870-biopygen1542
MGTFLPCLCLSYLRRRSNQEANSTRLRRRSNQEANSTGLPEGRWWGRLASLSRLLLSGMMNPMPFSGYQTFTRAASPPFCPGAAAAPPPLPPPPPECWATVKQRNPKERVHR